MTLVKSGFTNLEGLRDADVQDFVDILGVEEAKAHEIHEAVHQEPVTTRRWPRVDLLMAMSTNFRNTDANKNDDQDRSAQRLRTRCRKPVQGRRLRRDHVAAPEGKDAKLKSSEKEAAKRR